MPSKELTPPTLPPEWLGTDLVQEEDNNSLYQNRGFTFMNITPNSREILLQVSPVDEIQRWKEQSKEQQELSARAVSMHMFGDTVESIAHFVNHALSILTLDTVHCEMQLRRTAPQAGEEISQSFEEMRDEIKMIGAGVKAMLSFSNMVCAKYPRQKESSII